LEKEDYTGLHKVYDLAEIVSDIALDLKTAVAAGVGLPTAIRVVPKPYLIAGGTTLTGLLALVGAVAIHRKKKHVDCASCSRGNRNHNRKRQEPIHQRTKKD
jgi:hypothetical protein